MMDINHQSSGMIDRVKCDLSMSTSYGVTNLNFSVFTSIPYNIGKHKQFFQVEKVLFRTTERFNQALN